MAWGVTNFTFPNGVTTSLAFGGNIGINAPNPAIILNGTESSGQWAEIVEIAGDTWFLKNAYYNGAAFFNVNTTLPAYAFRHAANGFFQFYSAGAGSTAIVWTAQAFFDANGDLTLNTLTVNGAINYAGGGGAQFLHNEGSFTNVTPTATTLTTVVSGLTLALGTSITGASGWLVKSRAWISNSKGSGGNVTSYGIRTTAAGVPKGAVFWTGNGTSQAVLGANIVSDALMTVLTASTISSPPIEYVATYSNGTVLTYDMVCYVTVGAYAYSGFLEIEAFPA